MERRSDEEMGSLRKVSIWAACLAEMGFKIAFKALAIYFVNDM